MFCTRPNHDQQDNRIYGHIPEVAGYAHPGYANSLSMFGSPLLLPESGGWILRRQVGKMTHMDAMGCYPLFCCANWNGLKNDLIYLTEQDNLVSIVLVADPFHNMGLDRLKEIFTAVCIPFKLHHIVDLSADPDLHVDIHHRRNARWAGRYVDIECVQNPLQFLDDWMLLYNTLIARHDIRGIACFSRESFASQFRVPGLVVFRAVSANKTVGMALFYIIKDIGYYHLGAYSDEGYRIKASFALFQEAIMWFKKAGLACLDLGGGAGAFSDGSDGLNRFKKGWATGSMPAYLCGRVLNDSAYLKLCEGRQTSYFPAYRQGEFL